MIKSNFYPLRSIVGPSIPIGHIHCIPQTASKLKVNGDINLNLFKAAKANWYKRFLPDIVENGITYHPITGMDRLPLSDSTLTSGAAVPSGFLKTLENPPDSPFSKNDPVGFIYGYEENLVDFSKELLYSGSDRSYSFLIGLSKEVVVGGICFQGFPYISSGISDVEGITLGNFGLPREIQLTPISTFGRDVRDKETDFQSQFIDSEFAYTRQEIMSHSGLNYLCIDPVKTKLFRLTVTDLPFIPKRILLNTGIDNFKNPVLIKGFKGFAIPSLYFFEYKEKTKRSARLHAGLLGVKVEKVNLPMNLDERKKAVMRKVFPEFEYFFLNNGGHQKLGSYLLYSAHSALGQRRRYYSDNPYFNYPDIIKDLPRKIKEGKFAEECFISDLLKKNEKVTLYLQQGEEYDRFVAGFKALFLLETRKNATKRFTEKLAELIGIGTNKNPLTEEEHSFIKDVMTFSVQLPPETKFCEKIGLKIFEIDPIEGVSPTAVDLSSKYATLLAKSEIYDYVDLLLFLLFKGIPFKKVSTAKYFAVELTNLGDIEGQIIVHALQMVRSAHASVQPRPARIQMVNTMHYRLIGVELADDFSTLGTEGFNFSIDRVVAGQVKNILYSATSLLDLLHTGGARIQSNVRRRAFEEELSHSNGGGENNYEIRQIESLLEGWRKSESGSGVRGSQNWKGEKSPTRDGNGFEVFGNQEIRTHNRYLYPFDPDKDDHNKKRWYTIATDFINLLHRVFVLQNIPVNNNEIENLKNQLVADLISIPLGNELRSADFDKAWKGINVPDVTGLYNISQSPFALNQLPQVAPLFHLFNHSIPNLLGNFAANPLGAVADLVTLLRTAADPMAALAGAVTPFVNKLNGLSISANFQPLGMGLSFSGSPVHPQIMGTATSGSTGNIILQGSESKYTYSKYYNNSFDEGKSTTNVIESSSDRIVERKIVNGHEYERIKGAEIMWQGKFQDIITGSVPLNFTLPATATKMNYRTADDSLRVRFNSGFSPSVEVDFWFELTEEIIRDDY